MPDFRRFYQLDLERELDRPWAWFVWMVRGLLNYRDSMLRARLTGG